METAKAINKIRLLWLLVNPLLNIQAEENEFFEVPFNFMEMAYAIGKAKPAPGPDNIDYVQHD